VSFNGDTARAKVRICSAVAYGELAEGWSLRKLIETAA